MAGFLPPISVMHGFGHSRLKRRRIDIPTVFEPVKSRPSTPGCEASASPASSPLPNTTFRTPSGRPASRKRSCKARPMSDASWLGLSTAVFPATSAAPRGPPARAAGKLNGLMTAQTP